MHTGKPQYFRGIAQSPYCPKLTPSFHGSLSVRKSALAFDSKFRAGESVGTQEINTRTAFSHASGWTGAL